MRRLIPFLAITVFAGCTTILTRNPAPEVAISELRPYGVDVAVIRGWGDGLDFGQGDDASLEALRAWVRQLFLARRDALAPGAAVEEHNLALSGGGPDGAFGAGLLNGWTQAGDRPEFTLVSGVSTGAIIALFAYLGPDYDDELKEVYTSFSTDDILAQDLLRGVTGGAALADTKGYRGLIERYIGDQEMALIAQAYGEGRLLLIGTTNLDASRPVLWNIGAIAASGHPEAKRLVHDVIQASSAIPGAFPPVLIPVVGPDGETYDEMHVDGGATAQVLLLRPDLPASLLSQGDQRQRKRTIYVVINNKLIKPYEPVDPSLPAIAAKAASSLISGSGAGDIYKLFTLAERDGITLQVIAIPRAFDAVAQEAFDPVYMGELFDLGERMGREGVNWADGPPGFVRGN